MDSKVYEANLRWGAFCVDASVTNPITLNRCDAEFCTLGVRRVFFFPRYACEYRYWVEFSDKPMPGAQLIDAMDPVERQVKLRSFPKVWWGLLASGFHLVAREVAAGRPYVRLWYERGARSLFAQTST